MKKQLQNVLNVGSSRLWCWVLFGLALFNALMAIICFIFPSGFARFRYPPELLLLMELLVIALAAWYLRKVISREGETAIRQAILLGLIWAFGISLFLFIVARTPWNEGMQALLRTPISFLLPARPEYDWVSPGFSIFALVMHLLFLCGLCGWLAYRNAREAKSQQLGTWAGILGVIAFAMGALPLTALLYFCMQATGGSTPIDSFTLWMQIYMGVLPFWFLIGWIISAIFANLSVRQVQPEETHEEH